VGRFRLNLPATLRAQLPFLFVAFGVTLASAGLRTAFVARADGAGRARRLVRQYLKPARLLDLLRLGLAVAVVSYGYSWLKVFVPRLNPAVTDAALDRMDTVLHLGVGPNRLLIGLLPYPVFLRVLDVQYALFFVTLLMGVGWFLSPLSTAERARFASGFAFLWLVGSWWYVATPSLGPCYTFPSDYASVHPHIPIQGALQGALLHQYVGVREGRVASLNPSYGVAAMPSLHVAWQAFVALWARRRAPKLAAFFWIMAALTFFGSLLTGWHYAVDGYAGLLLAFLAKRWGERKGMT